MSRFVSCLLERLLRGWRNLKSECFLSPLSYAFTHANGDLEMEIYSVSTGGYVTGQYSGTDNEGIDTSAAAGDHWARVYGVTGHENTYDIVVTVR